MLLDMDRDKNINLIGEKVFIFCRTHIAVGHRIQGGSPGPLRLKYAVACGYIVTTTWPPHSDVLALMTPRQILFLRFQTSSFRKTTTIRFSSLAQTSPLRL